MWFSHEHKEALEILQGLLHHSHRQLEELKIMSKALDDLTAQVTANIAAETAAITAIQTGANDSVQLAALTTQLKTSADALTAATAAAGGTPTP
jgi:peptidoglycan hydrolase CwlO-like protein